VLIRLGHSPDPDDAFMFWAVATGRVSDGGFEFEHVLEDIQTLNEWALEGRLEVTAISLHTYPFVQDTYVLLPHGASMGSGYGPIVVAREPMTWNDLTSVEIAVPGRMTTAFLVLRLFLGAWWLLDTGLPLPLGVNVARRDLGEENLRRLSEVLARSIEAGLESREEALGYALRYGRGLDHSLADRFVGMYVNELTRDYGEEGRQAVAELLGRGERIGAFPGAVRVDFVALARR
jgi:1,4-dihydroxy-6-naphthoate synthase